MSLHLDKPLKYQPVVANVVRLPWEYSQIGCNSLEHSRLPLTKSRQLGVYRLISDVMSSQVIWPRRCCVPISGAILETISISAVLFITVHSRWALWRVYKTGKRLVVSQKILILSFCCQVAAAPWWLPVKGANWKHPDGPDSNIIDRYKTTLHKSGAPRNVFEIHSSITRYT